MFSLLSECGYEIARAVTITQWRRAGRLLGSNGMLRRDRTRLIAGSHGSSVRAVPRTIGWRSRRGNVASCLRRHGERGDRRNGYLRASSHSLITTIEDHSPYAQEVRAHWSDELRRSWHIRATKCTAAARQPDRVPLEAGKRRGATRDITAPTPPIPTTAPGKAPEWPQAPDCKRFTVLTARSATKL